MNTSFVVYSMFNQKLFNSGLDYTSAQTIETIPAQNGIGLVDILDFSLQQIYQQRTKPVAIGTILVAILYFIQVEVGAEILLL